MRASMPYRPLAVAPLVPSASIVAFLAAACGAAGSGAGNGGGTAPELGSRTLDDEPTMVAAPHAVSTAPACGQLDDAIGVCLVSGEGVTLQARRLPPGATASFTLDGDYASPPMGCRPRWVQRVTVDPGGVATARFEVPMTDRCRLLASMVARVFVEPRIERGPVRFGTMPPPAPR
jgi:hypothetical protein